ncbi:MAG: DNA repair protein RecN [Bacteroidales bacterium]|jgi:DNA repair protein RecN (Recombination protein N)|nr:DNA repair protein RecN [Bacteroidales bacterium]NLM93643.1 DNA repair protein RecN [Bacteroidales bacterium]
MLKHLLVENYALIEKLDLNFGEGFTVITGETGAGKSIMLGALALILGQRADIQVLMHSDRKCIVEGIFDLSSLSLHDLFEKHQLDYDELSCFRREITPQGKSRAFINDTPVNLGVMKEMAERLIDIHSQHQTLLLGESSFQFDVVDSFARHYEAVGAFRQGYRKWQQRLAQLEEMEQREKRSRADLDYFRFQYEELEKARLDPLEYERLEGELQVIHHSEEIRYNLEKAMFVLEDSEANVLGSLNEILQLLKPLAHWNENYRQLLSRFESVQIEVKDLKAELEDQTEGVVHDPARSLDLEQRIDLLNKLLLKHNATQMEELVRIREDYLEKIQAIDSLEEEIKQQREEAATMEKKLKEMALELSRKRKGSIPEIESGVSGMLHQLGMPGASFRISHQVLPSLGPNGQDQISFLFSANPGGEPREIARVASGGELSRLMLSVKSMISKRNLLPTIIFDEIDAGISGETATRVANILESISKKMQVIAITHLPQIASRGESHLLVYKIVEGGRARTEIRNIKDQDRILEIAKMLGGEKPTEVMLATARELIIHSVRN